MRVAILTSSYPAYRGDYAGIFVEKMALPLAMKGHQMSVVAPGCPGAARHEDHANLQVWRFRYFVPSLEKLAYGAGGIPENIRRNPLLVLLVPFFLAGFLWTAWRRSKGAELLHANWIIPAGWVAYHVAFLRRIPYVLTVRGSDLKMIRSNPFFRMMGGAILRKAAQVTTVSEALREEVLRFGVAPEKARVIPSGVAVNPKRPEGQERPELPRPRGVFVGSLRELKGVHVLLDALALLKEKGNKTTLWIVGDGPEEAALKKQAQELGLNDRVAFVGRCPHEEVGSWIAEADFLVLPSFSEGRPNVVYEAFACGVPVIATGIPGTKELVAHDERGLLVPPKDAPSLAAAIEKLAGNEVLSQHFSETAHQWLQSQGLTWDACAKNYLSAYEAALGPAA